jgi:hypothetical protein
MLSGDEPLNLRLAPGRVHRKLVAPTGSRLYRRLATGNIPRTLRTADYQSAIQPIANRRYTSTAAARKA